MFCSFIEVRSLSLIMFLVGTMRSTQQNFKIIFLLWLFFQCFYFLNFHLTPIFLFYINVNFCVMQLLAHALKNLISVSIFANLWGLTDIAVNVTLALSLLQIKFPVCVSINSTIFPDIIYNRVFTVTLFLSEPQFKTGFLYMYKDKCCSRYFWLLSLLS